jgi:RNA polymerase sigma factor (sigma-70 family)
VERRSPVLAEAKIVKTIDGAVAIANRHRSPERPDAARTHDEVVVTSPSRETDSLDERLVRQCLEGDEQAWSTLLDRYKRLIYSIPVKYGLTAQEATDIFQDVCVELLEELPRLREPRALPKWLGQVTSRKCSHLKRLANRHPSAGAPSDALDDVADTATLAEQVLLEVEREQTLRDAVTALSPRCRELIQALFYETPARSYREIATQLNLASGSIGFIRGRCLGRLRSELHKNGFR